MAQELEEPRNFYLMEDAYSPFDVVTGKTDIFVQTTECYGVKPEEVEDGEDIFPYLALIVTKDLEITMEAIAYRGKVDLFHEVAGVRG
jgi:hypothetical protein